MIKKIRINEEHSVEVNSSAGWLFIYRETFGTDVLPDLLPIVESALEAIVGLLEEAGEEVTTANIIEAFRSDSMIDAIAKFSTLEFITIIKIFWALAKNADKSIQSVEEWANSFEEFPLDIIVPELFSLVSSSLVSRKNLKRLKDLLAKSDTIKAARSISTSLPSEQSLEA